MLIYNSVYTIFSFMVGFSLTVCQCDFKIQISLLVLFTGSPKDFIMVQKHFRYILIGFFLRSFQKYLTPGKSNNLPYFNRVEPTNTSKCQTNDPKKSCRNSLLIWHCTECSTQTRFNKLCFLMYLIINFSINSILSGDKTYIIITKSLCVLK